MGGQAHRQAVTAVGAQTLGLVKAQRRAGGVDQEVIGDPRLAAGVEIDRHIWGLGADIALGMDRAGGPLDELDPRALIHRRERERDPLGLHQPHPDPDVGRHPVVLRPG
jgi:hypothetical protein